MKFSRAFSLMFAMIVGAAATRAAVIQVQMGTYFFNPTNVVLNPGDRVVWNNVSSQAHDSTSISPLWNSQTVNPGGSYGWTFTNLGYYPYYCQRHRISGPQQTGSVSVVAISVASLQITPTNAQFQVRGGRAGLRSVIEAGTNFTSLAPISTNPFPASGILNFTNNSPPGERRFYRARAIP